MTVGLPTQERGGKGGKGGKGGGKGRGRGWERRQKREEAKRLLAAGAGHLGEESASSQEGSQTSSGTDTHETGLVSRETEPMHSEAGEAASPGQGGPESALIRRRLLEEEALREACLYIHIIAQHFFLLALEFHHRRTHSRHPGVRSVKLARSRSGSGTSGLAAARRKSF